MTGGKSGNGTPGRLTCAMAVAAAHAATTIPTILNSRFMPAPRPACGPEMLASGVRAPIRKRFTPLVSSRGKKRTLPAFDIMSTTTHTDDVRAQLAGLLPRLRRFARVITRNVADADDLVQVAVEKALTRADAVAAGVAPGQLDVRHHEERLDRRDTRAPPARARARARGGRRHGRRPRPRPRATLRLSVQAAMARLARGATAWRSRWCWSKGLSYKDAAEALGIPMGTLTSRLARGREALQAVLGRDGG